MVSNLWLKKCKVVATVLAGVLLFTVLAPTAELLADPLLKPKKYHGPIPQKSFTFGIGFFGGAENEAFWAYLDRQIDQALRKETKTEDFGTSLTIDAIFTNKLHPNFAVRARAGASFLQSGSQGLFVAQVSDTSGTNPVVRFDRNFDVTLFALEASGLFYVQDASVKEFQIFFGGGFSLYVPWQRWSQEAVNDDTGEPFPAASEKKDTWSAEPGVHGILGMLYHFRNTWAVTVEGRVQIAQSKFALDNQPTEVGPQTLNFDVDYTGFTMAVGIARFF